MTTRNQVIRLAASQIGYTEGRSNITKYWAKLKPSFQGQPWCAAYVNWVLTELGVDDLNTGPWAPYYTPAMEQWAKKNGRWKASKDCKPGDVLIFGTSKGATHTGFLEKQDGNYVITIEGNTSSGSGGSQVDGGGVYRRRRPRSWVRGCISLDGILNDQAVATKAPAPAVKPRTKGPFPLPKGHWFGVESSNPKNHSGYYVKDRPGVKLIQAVVGTPVDGGYGKATKAAVVAWQKAHGLTADGEVGAVTWSKMGANSL